MSPHALLFQSLLAAIHVTGCKAVAFYCTRQRPSEAVPIGTGSQQQCASCGRSITKGDVELHRLDEHITVPEAIIDRRRQTHTDGTGDRRASSERRRHDPIAAAMFGRRATDITVIMLRDLATGPTLTTSQFANALGISSAKMRDLLASGSVKHAYRVGTRGDFRIPWAAARAYAASIGAIPYLDSDQRSA